MMRMIERGVIDSTKPTYVAPFDVFNLCTVDVVLFL